ncbi:MAG: hypothetical protein RL563_2705 [Pseudomonadota bacterium]
MPRFIDRTGQRFGNLVALERGGTNALKKILWRCRCDCGNEVNVVASALVTGNTKSCGCVIPNLKHGASNKSSYNTWRAMMRRCYNSEDKDFKRYGAVGVTVCSEWHDYTKFAADMGEPVGTQTLDRISPEGNYTKDNCRWATPTTQARNIRVPKRSKSGHIGVHLRRGKWHAEITHQKKKFYSRVCSTVEEAVAARKELERLHWGVA